jgi:hypothetical protein
MQLEQVNALLLEKVGLQSEGIGHREKMLQRERDFGCVPFFVVFCFGHGFNFRMAYSDLRAAMAGKDLPEDIKQKFLALHEENVTLKESYKTAQDKLNKAKQVIYLNMSRNAHVAYLTLVSSSKARTNYSRNNMQPILRLLLCVLGFDCCAEFVLLNVTSKGLSRRPKLASARKLSFSKKISCDRRSKLNPFLFERST